MKRDVVLADEVVALSVRVLPPGLPRIRFAAQPGPLLGCREIAHQRLPPHVDALAGAEIVDGQRDPPVEVTGEVSIVQAVLDHPLGKVDHVGPPALPGLQPLEQRLLEVAQPPHVVLGLTHHRGVAAQLAPGIDEVGRLESPAAVVALISPGVDESAIGAGPLHVAIGEKSPGLFVVELFALLSIQIAIVEQSGEEILGDPGVGVGAGGREQIVGDAEVRPVLHDFRVVAVDDLLWSDTLLVGANRDGCPVHIAAGHHQHVVAGGPLISGKDVRGQIGTGEMAEVARPAGVWPSNGDQDLFGFLAAFWHGRRWYSASFVSRAHEIRVVATHPTRRFD